MRDCFVLGLAAALLVAASPRVEAGLTLYDDRPAAERTPPIGFRIETNHRSFAMAARSVVSDRPYDRRIDPGSMIRVRASLGPRAAPMASLSIIIRAENDRRYDVHATVATTDPTRDCMGCSKAESAPIHGDSTQRLWLYWGFNGISHPILF